MKKLSLILIPFYLLILSARAQNKNAIKVDFDIKEPQYVAFYENETAQIEQECAVQMAAFLNQTFNFFDFNLEDETTTLHVELTDSEQDPGSTSNLKEVGFKVKIAPAEKPGEAESAYWTFRPMERYIEALPDVKEEFISEIMQTFKIGVHRHKEELVKNVLGQVKVTDDFHFVRDQKLFVLPLAEKENNITKFSLFLIVTEIPDQVFGNIDSYDTTQVFAAIQNKQQAIERYKLPNSYPQGSLALKKVHNNAAGFFDAFSEQDSIVKKIFILKHVPLSESELGIISPENILNHDN